MRKEVWSLHSSYKDGEAEGCGVFDSPRAMAVGLARLVHGAHQDDSRDDLVDAVALAVFDLFYRPENPRLSEPGLQDECRDGDTVYGYEINEVQSLRKENV